MQYKLLASDFDNTLVPFGEPCPRPAVVKAVKKMQAAGGKFVLSTGRGYCAINKQQLGGIRFDYAIANNGACVVDTRYDPDCVRKCRGYLRSFRRNQSYKRDVAR